MCGIYGFINLTGAPADPDVLGPMATSVLHRGPDDTGFHAEGACAIGMRRLSIIDLSGGHQPISNADGSVWVVCNGEIYNFRELRAELQARGCRFKTGSDTEVIIHLYTQMGDEFIHRLNGMYGFALWDARRCRLLIGRDRLGVKPVYIARTGKRIAFASEAKALLQMPGVHASIDTAALESYLRLGYVAAPQSLFRGIEKLPPASVLTVEADRVDVRRYWSLSPHVDRAVTEGQWIERVRDGIQRSVAAQMVSDVPLGAFLSGGIDSSSVVACMAARSAMPIKTYAIGFSGTDADAFYNELPYARRVAELFRTDHHEIVVRPNVASLLPRLIWHMDEPVADTAFVTTFLVSEFARRDVTVILSGVGGDELFGGYRRYLGNHYQAYFDRLPGCMRRTMSAIGRHLPSDRHSPLLNWSRLAKGFLDSAGLDLEERYGAYVQVFGSEEIETLLGARTDTMADPVARAFAESLGDDALNRMFRVDAQTQLPDDLLLLTDKMSMATSLECRVPLLDHELVEMAAAIPEGVKIRGGRLKHVMKEAMADRLPRDILDRKKRGFGTPMGSWLRGELAPLLRELLSRESLSARGLVNPRPVESLISAHNANRVDGTDRILALMNLEIWARIYLDGRNPADVTAQIGEAIA